MPKDNPKLWNMLKLQAQARWPNRRGPGVSPRGQQWASQQYYQSGGGDVVSKKDIPLKNRDFKQEEKDKAKQKAKRQKRELQKRGFVA